MIKNILLLLLLLLLLFTIAITGCSEDKYDEDRFSTQMDRDDTMEVSLYV